MPDDKNAKLTTALRQAKQGPMMFAFVAKGTTEGVLIVSRKRVPAKEVNEAKVESGGKKVFRGRCVFEDGKLIFEMAKEAPATLAKQLKKVIHESAGMMMQVETRVAADLQDEDEEGNETQSQESGTPSGNSIPPAPPPPSPSPTPTPSGQVPSPPSPPPPADPAAGRFATRLKALAPLMQRLEGLTSPSAKDAKLAIAEANTLFRSKKFAEANETLDVVEDLLKEALTAPSPTANGSNNAPTSQQNNPDAIRFAARLKALAPVAQKAETTGSDFARQAKWQIAEANKLYVAKKYNEANAALDQAESLIKQAFSGTGKQKQGYADALAAYQTIREQAIGRLREVASEIGAADHPDAAKGEIEVKGVISNLTQSPAAMNQVVQLEQYLQKDDVVFDVCDLAYDFRTPMLKSLAELKATLSA